MVTRCLIFRCRDVRGCHGNILCHSKLQFLNLLLQRCLQVVFIHGVLHKERLEDERHKNTERWHKDRGMTETFGQQFIVNKDGSIKVLGHDAVFLSAVDQGSNDNV